MDRFGWLLRREWMQHRLGWLILAGVPLILVLVVLPFGDVHFGGPTIASTVGLLSISVYIYLVLGLAAVAVVFQASGMARRDQQDRSIEFWLSLPTSHWQSILATVLMHVLLMPLLVLGIAFVGGQLVAAAVVVKVNGVAALGTLLSGAWLGFNAAMLLRLIVGLILAVLWIAPLLLMAMASAAWLKRWGVPAMAAGLFIGALLMRQLAGSRIVLETVGIWTHQAGVALMPLTRGGPEIGAAIKNNNDLGWFGQWLLGDTLQVLRDAASPQFVAGVLIAVVCFGLLVLRRMRGS